MQGLNMSKDHWYVVVVLILLACLVLYDISTIGETKLKAKMRFDEFNQANLNGYIEGVWIENKMVGFKLINHRSYVFNPYTDKYLNEGNIFDHIAEYGNKVIKEPYSDTLYLKKDGKVYKYLFRKFE
jgi:hypothetical protein